MLVLALAKVKGLNDEGVANHYSSQHHPLIAPTLLGPFPHLSLLIALIQTQNRCFKTLIDLCMLSLFKRIDFLDIFLLIPIKIGSLLFFDETVKD